MAERRTMGYVAPTPEDVAAIMRAAHRERAKYVAELFGFGFATAQKGLAGFGRKADEAPVGGKPATGCA